MDVEDVRGTLAPYQALLREHLEHYGGTVEKFIGDAVMAVFGAPIAHEDDPERAVRAALDVIESLAEAFASQLSVRIGIHTGEVVVDLDARPERGEGFVTGDVVNTAARIQAGAPVGVVAVGQSTYQATARVFEFEALEPIQAKGKSEPIDVWRPLRPGAVSGPTSSARPRRRSSAETRSARSCRASTRAALEIPSLNS